VQRSRRIRMASLSWDQVRGKRRSKRWRRSVDVDNNVDFGKSAGVVVVARDDDDADESPPVWNASSTSASIHSSA